MRSWRDCRSEVLRVETWDSVESLTKSSGESGAGDAGLEVVNVVAVLRFVDSLRTNVVVVVPPAATTFVFSSFLLRKKVSTFFFFPSTLLFFPPSSNFSNCFLSSPNPVHSLPKFAITKAYSLPSGSNSHNLARLISTPFESVIGSSQYFAHFSKANRSNSRANRRSERSVLRDWTVSRK